MEYQYGPGRIWAEDETGKVIAEVTFPACGGVATIDHTFVDPVLRGQGVAGKLVRMAADRIIEDGNRIAATCSYAVTWFEKHPEYTVIPSEDGPACKLSGRH